MKRSASNAIRGRYKRHLAKNKLSHSELIAVMAILRDEWKARDISLQSIFWKIIYLSLIITFLPNLVDRLGVTGTPISRIPEVVFSIVGILCALFGMYLALGESKRIEAIDMLYKRIMNEFPNKYQMIDLPNLKHGAFFSIRMNTIFCIVPYAFIIILALIKILYYYNIL